MDRHLSFHYHSRRKVTVLSYSYAHAVDGTSTLTPRERLDVRVQQLERLRVELVVLRDVRGEGLAKVLRNVPLRMCRRALQAVPRRLRGRHAQQRREDAERLALALERPDERQARVWLATASYLDRRLQSSRVESPGRDPDMSVEAAAAFRVALAEVAQLASEALGVTTPSEQEPPQNVQP